MLGLAAIDLGRQYKSVRGLIAALVMIAGTVIQTYIASSFLIALCANVGETLELREIREGAERNHHGESQPRGTRSPHR